MKAGVFYIADAELTALLERALEPIPDESKNTVFEFLKERGIRGFRTSHYCCPIARYLQRETRRPFVMGRYTIMYVTDGWVGGPITRPEVVKVMVAPTVLMNFVDHFDYGGFSELLDGVGEYPNG